MKKAQERPQVNFRPSAGLKKRLQGAADHNGVPLNAEIIKRLEQSFVNEVLANLIETTATRVATEVSIQLKDQMMSYVNATLVANELYEKRKKDEQQRQQEASNG
jgi:hypothetical protein